MIPLARPSLGSAEARAVEDVLHGGQLTQGPYVARFEQALAERCERVHGVAVSSGTSALLLALRALDIGPGDDVLVPALTWPSPAHAVWRCGARPVLVDVDPHEWNATAEALAAARTEQTKAAIGIDQLGNPLRCAAIERALSGLEIVEDAACALGARFDDGRACGSMGTVSCLSFHPRKVVTTGEGGACVTNDGTLAKRVRALRDHGRGDDGVFHEASENHRLPDTAAAIGLAQLERLDAMLEARRVRAARYREALPGLAFQQAPTGATPSHQTCGVRLSPRHPPRDAVITALRARGIETGPVSVAVHRLRYLRAGAQIAPQGVERTETLVDQGLALPLFPDLRDDDQEHVIGAMLEVLEEREAQLG